MTLIKFLLTLCLATMPVFVLAEDGDDDLLKVEQQTLRVFEDNFRAFLAENTGVIQELASRPELGNTDSGKVLQALCSYVERFQRESHGAMPSVAQMQQEMDRFFKETGFGTEHCYELCENYVPWSQWFADLGWGSLDLGKQGFWGTLDYAAWGASLGWYYTGAQALYYGAQYLPEFMTFLNEKTAHLNYESEKLDQVLGLVGSFASFTPYSFPLALVIGLYYYDDLFPGEQTLIQENQLNQILIARMAYSAGLASMTSFWLRTWAHLVPKAGLDRVSWNSGQAARWALYALPVGLAAGYVIDAKPVVSREKQPSDVPSPLFLAPGLEAPDNA